MGQSVVLGYLANYFTISDPTPEDTRDAYLYAAGTYLKVPCLRAALPVCLPPLAVCAGLVSMSLFVTVIHGHGFLVGQKAGMMARVMCTNAIYQKVQCGHTSV